MILEYNLEPRVQDEWGGLTRPPQDARVDQTGGFEMNLPNFDQTFKLNLAVDFFQELIRGKFCPTEGAFNKSTILGINFVAKVQYDRDDRVDGAVLDHVEVSFSTNEGKYSSATFKMEIPANSLKDTILSAIQVDFPGFEVTEIKYNVEVIEQRHCYETVFYGAEVTLRAARGVDRAPAGC